MNKDILKITEVFTASPGPRYKKWGDFSGEEFLEDYFIPWLEKHKNDKNTQLIVDLNGAIGYPPSFLEETFGGAIRKGYGNIVKKIDIIYDIPYRIKEIKLYIENALKLAEVS